jgi:hypothetical protein
MKNVVIYSFLFFLFILFNSDKLFAQKNFIEGYIITLKKDTLKGTIDNREWNLNPSSIQFIGADGKKSTFKPDDISGFFVPPKDLYISSHVSIDLSSLEPKDLVEHKAPKAVKDTALFLLTVVKGKASLYYMKDHNNREHYYVSKDDASLIELLIKKSYMDNYDGNTMNHNYLATVELFKGQLILLFEDCPSLKRNINNSEYLYSNIRSLVIKYNECQHSSIDFVKRQEPIKCKFGLLAGPTLTKVSYKGGNDYLTGAKMSDCYDFLAGVSCYIIFPRGLSQWVLVNELIYKPYSNSGSIKGITQDFGSYYATFSFDMAYLKINNLLRYQIPKWKVRPFADLGISNGYAVKSSNSRVVQTSLWTTTITRGKAIENPRLYEFGVTGGLGISWWKFNGELRYEWADGMSPFAALHGYENSIYFIIGFLF